MGDQQRTTPQGDAWNRYCDVYRELFNGEPCLSPAAIIEFAGRERASVVRPVGEVPEARIKELALTLRNPNRGMVEELLRKAWAEASATRSESARITWEPANIDPDLPPFGSLVEWHGDSPRIYTRTEGGKMLMCKLPKVPNE